MDSAATRGLLRAPAVLLVVSTLVLASIVGFSASFRAGAAVIPSFPTERIGALNGNNSSGLSSPPAPQDNATINVTGVTYPTSYTSGWTIALQGTATGSGYTCAWTFGDGGTANTCSTTHTISSNGRFTWTLTVSEPDGSHPVAKLGVDHQGCGSGSSECPDMFWCDWRYGGCGIEEPPIVDCIIDCEEGAYAQLLSSSTGAVSGASYSWSFGDGQHGMGDPVSHTYSEAGTYTAGVTATLGSNQYSASLSLKVPL